MKLKRKAVILNLQNSRVAHLNEDYGIVLTVWGMPNVRMLKAVMLSYFSWGLVDAIPSMNQLIQADWLSYLSGHKISIISINFRNLKADPTTGFCW
jgi:hypothetical protein